MLIGPNGSGKSNLIEAFALLAAAPGDLEAAVEEGGGAGEWIWKGRPPAVSATLDVELAKEHPGSGRFRYRLEFSAAEDRFQVVDEAIEEAIPLPGEEQLFFHYRFRRGDPVFSVQVPTAGRRDRKRRLRREGLLSSQSVLAQREDPALYPEVAWVGRQFRDIQLFRDSMFGRPGPPRHPRQVGLRDDRLRPDGGHLARVLSEIEHGDGTRFNEELRRVFPGFRGLSPETSGDAMPFRFHEDFDTPVPAARLSDGTIRFIAILATLLDPSPPPLVCIEHPELGLHPDAAAQVGELLIEASSRMQLVVTTHSESLVSALTERPDAVIVCERPGPATTLCRLDPEHLGNSLDDGRLGPPNCGPERRFGRRPSATSLTRPLRWRRFGQHRPGS